MVHPEAPTQQAQARGVTAETQYRLIEEIHHTLQQVREETQTGFSRLEERIDYMEGVIYQLFQSTDQLLTIVEGFAKHGTP